MQQERLVLEQQESQEQQLRQVLLVQQEQALQLRLERLVPVRPEHLD